MKKSTFDSAIARLYRFKDSVKVLSTDNLSDHLGGGRLNSCHATGYFGRDDGCGGGQDSVCCLMCFLVGRHCRFLVAAYPQRFFRRHDSCVPAVMGFPRKNSPIATRLLPGFCTVNHSS